MEAPQLRHLLLIGAGGVVGALSRYGIDQIFGDIALATFIVNLFGVAVAAICTFRLELSPEQKLFVVPGFAGSFTTYSAFVVLLYELALARAGLYIVASLILSLAMIRLIRAGVR